MVQTYLHSKLHQLNEQHSVSVFTPLASRLWSNTSFHIISAIYLPIVLEYGLIRNSFQDAKQNYEWRHTQNKINYSQKMPSGKEKIMVFSCNFQTWDESSFTVSGSVTRAFWKQQGCPLLLNQQKTTKKTAPMSSAINITKGVVNMFVCVFVRVWSCMADGGWAQQAALGICTDTAVLN